jgi:hypothetical protein
MPSYFLYAWACGTSVYTYIYICYGLHSHAYTRYTAYQLYTYIFSVSIQTSAIAKGALQLVRNCYIKDIEKNPGQNKPVYASVNTTVGFANSCLGPMSQKLH